MPVNPLVLITVPQLDHKLLDTTPLTSRTKHIKNLSAPLSKFYDISVLWLITSTWNIMRPAES